MKITWRSQGRNGDEMRCLVCMKHRVKWLVKQDENDNEILILNKNGKLSQKLT